MSKFALLALTAGLLAAPAHGQHAQHAPHAPRSTPHGTSRSAKPAAPTVLPAARVTLDADSAGDDSVRVIIARDLDLGDRVSVVAPTATDTAVTRVRIVRTSSGLQAALLDPASGAPREARGFPVPVVPAPRDSVIADSLLTARAARAAQRDSSIRRLQATRDSLAAEQQRKPPHFWTRGARRSWDEARAARDTAIAITVQGEATLRAEARRDSVVSDSVLHVLVARDAAVRDSLARARRWAIHGVADGVQELVTGIRGIAQSRIAYVSGATIRVIDFDGANDRAVTPPTRRSLSPAWRHDGAAIVYSDLADAGSQIAWIDLDSGAVHVLDATRRGLNITPVFTPDDRAILFANSDDIRTNLVMVRLDSPRVVHRITNARSYDCESPTVSPDGLRVAYTSSRRHAPEIYSSLLDGTDERLETPVAARVPYRAAPDWSPDGTSIAFEQQNGDFQVWTLSRTTHAMRRLTTTGQNEDPSWAPDSRHLALSSSRGGAKAIWIVDTVTGRVRQLTHSGDGRLAAWSPLLASSH